MIKTLVSNFLILLLSCGLLAAQKNYRSIDKRAIETPASEMSSVQRLASYLTAATKDDYEKARAIYTWMTHHITYSDTTISNGWLGTTENKIQQQAENVLKNRSAVCEGFANLYKALCTAAGLQSEIVTGVVKQEDGSVSNVGHAWNAVQLEGQWHLTDPTWGSGYADYWTRRFIREHQEAYFLVPAELMIQAHLPDDPIWQLLPSPITEQEFRSLSSEKLSARAVKIASQPFVFQDSIQQWFQQDSIQQMLHASERILRYNPENSVALARLGNHFYNQALTIFFRGEEQILQSLDNTQQRLDTAQLFSQFLQAEKLLHQAWQYYKRVADEKLQSGIQELASELVLQAEFNYLRGLIHVWEVTQQYIKLTSSIKKIPDDFYPTLYAQAQRAQASFSAAESVYLNQTGAIYKDALQKVKLHQALLYNYIAKAEGAILELSEDLSETALHTLAARLEQGVATYQKMLAIVNEVLMQDPTSVLGNSFLEESPLVLAAFEADRGFVYQFVLRKKYRTQWENPALISKTTATEITAAYLKCNDYINQGLKYLKAATQQESLSEFTKRFHSLQSNMYAYIGDIQMRYLANTLNRIKTESEFDKQKKSLLTVCNDILHYYNRALELVGNNQNAKNYLLDAIAAVQSTRKKLDN